MTLSPAASAARSAAPSACHAVHAGSATFCTPPTKGGTCCGHAAVKKTASAPARRASSATRTGERTSKGSAKYGGQSSFIATSTARPRIRAASAALAFAPLAFGRSRLSCER